MARFRATILGQRGSASRLGSKNSGLTAVVNGWNVGIRVEASVDPNNGNDVIRVYRTGGSNARSMEILLAEVPTYFERNNNETAA